MAARGLRGSGRAFVAAGFFAGLATLARNDGLLVLAALGIVFAWDRWRSWRAARATDSSPGERRRRPISWAAAVGAVAVFVLVMAPWWARQLAVFGSLSPSSTSGKVLFIRDIGEWNSITIPASLDHLLGMGIGPLIETRIGGAIAALTIFVTLVCGFILAPVLVIGAWARRRSTDFAAVLRLRCAPVRLLRPHLGRPRAGRDVHPLGRCAGALQLHPGPRGDRPRHRLGRRAPAGLGSSIRRVRIFGGATLVFAVVVAIAGSLVVHAIWSARRDDFLAVAAALDAAGAPPSDRVMSIDASGTALLERARRRRPGQRSARHDPRRRHGLRHPLARPRPRRRGRRPSRRILDGDRRPGLARTSRSSPRAARPARRLSRCVATAMTRRESLPSAVAIFVVALVVRVVFAAQIVFPKPEDTAYYVGVARNLVEGRGLVSDALWSYQTPPLVVPARRRSRSGCRCPTFLAAIPMAILGATFAAAQSSSILIGRDRPGPRLAAGRRRRRGARPAARPRPDARRSGRA